MSEGIEKKKKRKNLLRNKAIPTDVIYVNGIPISKDIVIDPTNNDTPVEDHDAFLDAEEMFKKYDRDHSGGIDLDEFKFLLHDLNFNIPDGKAIVYFRKCDLAQKGFITFDEFRVALFTCDPSNPQRTGGFCPGKALTPIDIFSIFDADESGEMGRDEFEAAMKFLKIKMPLDKMENIFAQYENPDSEALDYKAFRAIWLTLTDIRRELINRSIPYNKLLPKAALVKKLEAILDKEEAQEKFTLEEAKWNIHWEKLLAERKKLIDEARRFANYILGDALDSAGHVYVFGKGSFNRFDGVPAPHDYIDSPYFDTLLSLWTRRLHGANEWSKPVEETKPLKTNGWESPKKKKETQQETESSLVSKPRDMIQAQQLAFQNRLVVANTAWLWGRRIKHVSCGSSVAYALTDTGEVYCWGGSQRRWNYLYHAGDEDLPLEKRPFTARTEQLKLQNPAQARQDEKHYQNDYTRQVFRENGPPKVPEISTEERRRGLLAVVEYFNLGETTTTEARAELPLPKLEELIDFDLNAEYASNAIRLRGLRVNTEGKDAVVNDLSRLFLLEIECMGNPFHERMKRMDKRYNQALHDNNTKSITDLLKKGASTWKGMRKLYHSIEAEEKGDFQAKEMKWEKKKQEILRLRQKKDRIGRESIQVSPEKQTIEMSGLTTRGPRQRQFQGSQSLQEISVGAKHALAIHASGQLYGWGFGGFGRMGNGEHQDIPVPKPLPHLEAMQFRAIACGYSHSMALRMDGQIYIWGSAATGKLGIEPETQHVARPSTTPVIHRQRQEKKGENAKEMVDCFAIVPLPLPFPAKVTKIACGPSHSAAITIHGELFVWGSGDGGRLGLGDGRFKDTDNQLRGGLLGVVTTPTQVISLKHEYLVDVSCGVSHTATITAIESKNSINTGGRIYVCGSAHSLGNLYPSFRTPPELNDVSIVHVSCGNAHTAAVTIDGEVYTWGNNSGGCTGHLLIHQYIKVPKKLTCIYQLPQNMARNKLYPVCAMQSSVNSGYLPTFAIDGNTNGQYEATCTQTFREISPFWQVDLGVNCRLVKIVIWNRTDDTAPHLFPCLVMISEIPFEPESGKFALRACMAHSIHMKFNNGSNPLTWHLPENTLGRYIRLQLDSTNILSIAQVQVFGQEEWKYLGPKANIVTCGDDVTMVVCRPQALASEIEMKYLRALSADRKHGEILKEFHTFGSAIEKFINWNDSTCLLCSRQRTCPICTLYKEIPKEIPKDALPSDYRKTYTLDQVAEFLLTHRPPRTFAMSATSTTEEEKRLMQLAMDDEQPERDHSKFETLAVSTAHRAMKSSTKALKNNPTLPQQATTESTLTSLPKLAPGTSPSFLQKAMAKVKWHKGQKDAASLTASQSMPSITNGDGNPMNLLS